ncbi:UDP-N-acetylmuramoylalanine--D-glutamate ligase [Tepidanaerobacter syntrophicus]|uniref:UDP-N-acetylmuramoylalanine--D-glutamate ligase n=2 Tax=Tepidanaerobacter syntrophicus TaxID=224999 RepID=A0A0U9HFM8_9FIRM|nr:UDP-N-acetylmuramoyl-L-alanine--D-glutamate ligase [Tepidanaerobacter syntrophicus]GAQ25501.1 UDP-N-acetylmuramoylalanine--D-glutamate ligase [Tepidanaerobacter syntrophicus]GLI18544.1 UDP-N-acetylmuramoylalanine--D-glutamate ligase [Tepidanaerobacter syntrophicus]
MKEIYMDFKNKYVLILGLARSGSAAAIKLSNLGAHVTISDIKPRETFENTDVLESKGIKLVFEGHPLTLLDNCDLLVLSPGIPSDIEIVTEAKKRNIPVISELELGYRFAASPIIAITGTNGKTTTTTLIGEILKNDGKRVAVAGNIGTPLVSEVEKTLENDYLVVEVSSFQLENILYFKPKISIILNITEDHLNRHKTFENYVNIKARIFENQTEEDYTILNYDDAVVRELARYAKSDVWFFSRKDVVRHGACIENDMIVIKNKGKTYPIAKVDEIGIKGSHNLENALAAACSTYLANSKVSSIAKTLKSFRGIEHRLEFVAEINGIKFINDSKATNPDAAQKAIEAVDGPIILIAGGYDKKSDYTDFVKSFDGKVKKLILIGETADAIENAAIKQGFLNVEKVNSLKEAVMCGYRAASCEDTVLLSPACASWDMFANFEERGRLFKEAVNSLKK